VTTAILKGYHNRPTQLLPRKDFALVVWGSKITGDISGPLRFHASNAVAWNYLQQRKKNKWMRENFEEVDWQHLNLALKNKTDMYKIWRSKQASGFCGTWVQVGIYSGE
jgi:hypothetical protein